MTVENTSKNQASGSAEWAKFLSLAFVILPILALLAICVYGFVVWFGQILFWGPPT